MTSQWYNWRPINTFIEKKKSFLSKQCEIHKRLTLTNQYGDITDTKLTGELDTELKIF